MHDRNGRWMHDVFVREFDSWEELADIFPVDTILSHYGNVNFVCVLLDVWPGFHAHIQIDFRDF